MKRSNAQKAFLSLLIQLMLCPIGVLSQHEGMARTERMNIIFICTDDWGFGDLGAHGNTAIKTPVLDRFAEESLIFTRFHVTSGVCSPSRASMLTGQFPARHSIHGHFAGNAENARRGMPDWLPDTIANTLPALFRKAGYATGHFGKWHLGGGGLPNGDLSAPSPTRYGYDEARVWNGNGPTWNGIQPWPDTRYMDDDLVWNQHAAELAVDASIDFIIRHQSKPFFINLWLKEPHSPLLPSAAQRKDFLDVPEPEQTYFAVIREADKQIGRLLRKLDELDLKKNTLIVFTSDNGPESNTVAAGAAGTAAPYRGGKRSLYEGGVVVPFMVNYPGRIPKHKVDSTTIISSVDLLPTFCSIAGIPLDESFKGDGESFHPVLVGRAWKREKPLFWEWRFSRPDHKTQWMNSAVLMNGWKLLQHTGTRRVELYQVWKDPFEARDLAKAYPDQVAKMQQHWQSWKQTLPP
jgi:N-acetylgalactosamine-6-sulfatase